MGNVTRTAWRKRIADILAVCLVAGVVARHAIRGAPPPPAPPPTPQQKQAAVESQPPEEQQREQIARLIGQGLKRYWRPGGSILILYSPHLDPGTLTTCQESWLKGLADGLGDRTLTIMSCEPIKSYQAPSLSGPKPLVAEEFNRALRKYSLDQPLAVVSFAGLPTDDPIGLVIYSLECPPFVAAYFPKEHDPLVVESLLKTGYLHAAVAREGDELKLCVPPAAQE